MIGFALEGIPNSGKSHTLKRLFDELLTNNLVDIMFYKKAKNIRTAAFYAAVPFSQFSIWRFTTLSPQ